MVAAICAEPDGNIVVLRTDPADRRGRQTEATVRGNAAQHIEQSLSRFAVRLGGIVAYAARFTVFGRNGGGEGEDRTNRRLDLVRVQQLAERLRAAQEQRGGEQHCGNAGGDEQRLLFLVHGWGSFPTSNLLLPSNRGEGDRFPTVYLIKSFLASPSSGVT